MKAYMRALDDYLADRIKLEPCPRCGKSGKNIWIIHFNGECFCECPSCYYRGEAQFSQVGACLAWNRNANRMRKK